MNKRTIFSFICFNRFLYEEPRNERIHRLWNVRAEKALQSHPSSIYQGGNCVFIPNENLSCVCCFSLELKFLAEKENLYAVLSLAASFTVNV